MYTAEHKVEIDNIIKTNRFVFQKIPKWRLLKWDSWIIVGDKLQSKQCTFVSDQNQPSSAERVGGWGGEWAAIGVEFGVYFG